MLVLCHRAVRRCSAATVTSSRRVASRRPRRRPCQGNKVYKALSEHWIYDPSEPVYLNTLSELVENLPLQDSTTHIDPGLGPSLCPPSRSELLRAANPLKGNGSFEHSVALCLRQLLFLVLLLLRWTNRPWSLPARHIALQFVAWRMHTKEALLRSSDSFRGLHQYRQDPNRAQSLRDFVPDVSKELLRMLNHYLRTFLIQIPLIFKSMSLSPKQVAFKGRLDSGRVSGFFYLIQKMVLSFVSSLVSTYPSA